MTAALFLLAAMAAMAVLAAGAGVYLRQPIFGQTPEGQARQTLQASPHQVDGVFENQLPTPMLRDGENFASIMWKNLTSRA